MISGYINSTPFSVYTYGGEIVVYIPYYISWTPSDISGSFSIGGSTYSLEDYNGYFEFECSSITSSAFTGNSGLRTITTNAEEIQLDAFKECINLLSVSLSKCTSIGNSAFYKCYSLSSLYAPYVEYIGKRGLENCSSLTTLNLPFCEYIESAGVAYCLSMSSVSIPMCLELSNQAFYSCPALSVIDLPACEIIGDGAFTRCYSLSSVSIPVCEIIGSSVFRSCSALSSIDLPMCSYIGEEAFSGCVNFNRIILGSSSVCVLSNSNAMTWTKITSSTGFIIVPTSLYESYRTTDEWSYFFPRIMPEAWSSNYISWTPSTLSGYFRISGTEYNMRDWKGYFNWFDGVITSSAFGRYHAVNTTSRLTYIETNATRIDESAFCGINVCSCVSLSKCSYIGSYAFWGYNFTTNYGELRKIYAPNCEYIGSYAFENHWFLSTIDLPKCSYIGEGAFQFAGEGAPPGTGGYMIKVSLPKCEYIGSYAFGYLGYPGIIQLPKCSYIGEGVFGLAKITTIIALRCKYVGYRAFLQCSNLTDVMLDACEYVGSEAFKNCNLTYVALNCSYIGNSAFYSNKNLTALKITYSSVCYLGVNALGYTPLASRSGSIYVPSSLVSSYKEDPFWSYYSNLIYPIPS